MAFDPSPPATFGDARHAFGTQVCWWGWGGKRAVVVDRRVLSKSPACPQKHIHLDERRPRGCYLSATMSATTLLIFPTTNELVVSFFCSRAFCTSAGSSSLGHHLSNAESMMCSHGSSIM